MSYSWNDIRTWVIARDMRERIFLAILLFIVTYVLWNFLINRPLVSQKKTIEKEIDTTRADIAALKEQINSILDITRNVSYIQKLQQQKKLTSQSQNFKQ